MKDKFNKKYIIITKDLQKNLIDFLDEIQFDMAGGDDKESMHKVNFISWAINELLSGYEAYFPKDILLFLQETYTLLHLQMVEHMVF